jgi:hypothetical protein
MRKGKESSAAILTIFDASNMTNKGRRDISTWLKKQAEYLTKEADQFSKRYTARFIYFKR